MMAAKDRAATHERERQRFEAQALGAAAKRRHAKPDVSRADVETLLDSMTPQVRAEVILAAVHRLRVSPAAWPK
jgi:hypothetical protein